MEENPFSIPQIIRNETLEFTADVIGIVASVYGHEMPPMVKEFVQKAVFHTDYYYIILTYGNRHGGASELAETFCREYGIAPSYINVLLMVDNWLPGFDISGSRTQEPNAKLHRAQSCTTTNGLLFNERLCSDCRNLSNRRAYGTECEHR